MSTDSTGASSKRSAAKHAQAAAAPEPRIDVRKTYKLYVGGAFPRSESGRVYPVTDGAGRLLAQAAQASRKDVRDTVVAARKAFGGWSGATAYNRGQVLYRVAEMLEGRRAQFEAEVAAAEGSTPGDAADQVDAAIDRWVWYAGWTDKYAQVAGATNPVAGPYFNFSLPEPTGVVGIVAPQRSSLLGLISVLAPAIAVGNVAVVLAAQDRPLPAVTLAEVLATSDLPGGVVNLLTGLTAELTPPLASHRDLNALDLTGVPPAERAELQRAAADSVTRVFIPSVGGARRGSADGSEPDWASAPGIGRMSAFTEIKTVWHPIGV